jgi:hypothetical protein
MSSMSDVQPGAHAAEGCTSWEFACRPLQSSTAGIQLALCKQDISIHGHLLSPRVTVWAGALSQQCLHTVCAGCITHAHALVACDVVDVGLVGRPHQVQLLGGEAACQAAGRVVSMGRGYRV